MAREKATPASWKPRQSGNPNGRPPKGTSFADALRAVATTEEQEKVARAMLKAAKAGNVHAATLIRDTLDGKPPQRLEHSGDENAPLRVIVGPRNAGSS